MSRFEEIVAQILTWSDDDRQGVIDAIEESIQSEIAANLSPEQRAELRRRLAEHRANPHTAVSLEKFEELMSQELDADTQDVDDLKIAPEQEAELARRVAEHDANPSSALTMEEVFRGLRRQS